METTEMGKFCFVILHYRTADDTIKCIQSIQNLDDESEIVVVDNASNNGSIEQVEALFQGQHGIYILKNKENLGFAAGNNVGYQFAKEKLHASFIAISNNDIVVDTRDFISKTRDFYKEYKFDIMGPDIVSMVDGGHQNPRCNNSWSVEKARKEILRYRFLLLISKIGIYDILKPNKKVRTGSTIQEIAMAVQENVILHGAFVIFSPHFIQEERIAFREGTFLYFEEAILEQYAKIKHYKMFFYPFIRVYHKEDSSTNSIRISNKSRREFVFRNMIQSLKVYCNNAKNS